MDALHSNVGDGGIASEAPLSGDSYWDEREDEDEDEGSVHFFKLLPKGSSAQCERCPVKPLYPKSRNFPMPY
jgi:hypothetical protein